MQPLRLLHLYILIGWCCFAPDISAQSVVPPYAERALREVQSTDLSFHDEKRNRDVPVKIYRPSNASGALPVILFSHGLGGTRNNYRYIGEQWAANGYISVHLQHIGSDDSIWRGSSRPMDALRKAANGQNAMARPLDVKFVIDQLDRLNRNGDWKNCFDLSRIGISGHSFGGQTSFLCGGQKMARQSFADPRIKAMIPMSPAVPEFGDLDAAYADVTIPTFVMTGTLDDSPIGGTKVADRRKPFDHLPAGTTGYLLIFNGGDHMVFSGRARAVEKATDAAFQQFIRTSSTAFWDAYLKDDPAAKAWLRDGGFSKALGEHGTFEMRD